MPESRPPTHVDSRPRRAVPLVGIVAVLLPVLAACAAGPNNVARMGTHEELAGFWLGLWQGLISPITFLISLFNDNVNIYEVHNSGNWYNFGFMLGVSIIFSGTGRSACAASGPNRRRKRSGP